MSHGISTPTENASTPAKLSADNSDDTGSNRHRNGRHIIGSRTKRISAAPSPDRDRDVEHTNTTDEAAPDPAQAFRAIVKAVCKRTKEIDKALKKIVAALNEQPELRDSLLERFVRAEVLQEIYEFRHKAMGVVKHNACPRGIEAIEASSAVRLKSFLDEWTLPDGRVLGDATGADLDVMSETEAALANGHAKNSRFYKLIREHVEAEETVRDKLDDTQTAEIWNTAAADQEVCEHQ